VPRPFNAARAARRHAPKPPARPASRPPGPPAAPRRPRAPALFAAVGLPAAGGNFVSFGVFQGSSRGCARAGGCAARESPYLRPGRALHPPELTPLLPLPASGFRPSSAGVRRVRYSGRNLSAQTVRRLPPCATRVRFSLVWGVVLCRQRRNDVCRRSAVSTSCHMSCVSVTCCREKYICVREKYICVREKYICCRDVRVCW